MRRFLQERLGYKRAIGGIAAGLAVTAVATSVAIGGLSSAPDGSERSARSTASAALLETRCGPDIGEIVRTDNTQRTTTNAAFTTLPGAAVSVSVPSGTTRCIKVLFTAEAACSGNSGATDDFCYVRALDNGVEMNPQGASFQALTSESRTAKAHAYEWVRRVGAGVHTIAIQWRADGGGTSFFIDEWSMDVKITN